MTEHTEATGTNNDLTQTAILLYKENCGVCEFLSRLVVMLSLGTIQRIPLTDPAVQPIIDRYPQVRERPTLLFQRRVIPVPRLLVALPVVIVMSIWLQLWRRS